MGCPDASLPTFGIITGETSFFVEDLGNGAVDLVRSSGCDLDEFRELRDLIVLGRVFVEQTGLENRRPDRKLILVCQDVVIAEDV